ncbi:Malonyl CoA-acyl carrier protein transacylase [Streptococcus parauberis]|uniref:Malonyl CoA-acyl carrier protein transacylase n=1 Tax=Streptococcus parauberis TaxID=1348 RepID=A0A854WEM6_9STRE|nr:ACP S-malonyltransferase [Streptococcus parauberis]PCH13280.1 Malonyl CoA-acyl carrier protein transacylase [Streptococcus parauberis]
MTKLAFLFAGQGAQTVGMARDLYDTYPIIKETFEQANSVLGYDIRSLIDQDSEKLNQTRYTQPAILTTSVAIYRLLVEKGIHPDLVAGLSLGEYSALVATDALSFEDALQLVQKRGQLMEEAAPAGTGKMVAILNTDASLIETACEQASSLGVVAPANYNTPNQIVIGGQVEAVERALALLKEEGVKRMIPLNVSGPFHTALLESASQELAKVLEKQDFKEIMVPLVGNTEASVMKSSRIKELLTRQVMEPVRFYDSIETIRSMGINHFVEIGPGKVLTGFVKKIDKNLSCISIDSVESLKQYLNQ